MEPEDFRETELDRESRIPDEPYPSRVEQTDPQDSPRATPSHESENGARIAPASSVCSTEDAEPQVCSSGVIPANWPRESAINREKGAHPLGETRQDPAKRALSSDTIDARRSAQSYFNAGLPWTGEFEDLVNAGLVDVS